MNKHWCYFFFMLWLTYLITSSILLFSKGFLLSRVTQEANATCLSFKEIPCISENESQCSNEKKLSYVLENFDSASNICLPQKARVVLLIVDALRHDFTIYNESNSSPLPFQNKLPIIDKLRKQYPDRTRLYKALADPPTTTMQRLKALTTGSLPTFIDAGSNFATPEITEDNIIDQVIRNNLSAVFMGDDTWNKLYPNRFLRNFPFPSFYVWDLDTVDNGVRSHIYHELNRTDWDLLIGHFLGVDHCGHRYGPKHPEMARKLDEINDVIGQVVNGIDNNTILFVIGDHGMTGTGDHGGVSTDEISAGLFVYSKQPLYKINDASTTVKQISIVPTISTILGIPIPFSNLGTLILDSLPEKDLNDWYSFMYSLWANIQQMMTYIEEYTESNSETFTPENLQKLKEKYSILNGKIRTISDKKQFEVFIEECNEFLAYIRQNCEEIWIKFDSFAMTRGLLLLFASMFFIYMIIDGIPIDRLPEIFGSSFLSCSYFAMFLTVCLSAVLFYFGLVSNLLSTIYFSTGLISQFMLALLIIQNWELISLSWYDRSKKERIPNVITRAVTVFSLSGLFSNSFILEESFMLMFMLNSIIIIATWNVNQQEGKKKPNYKLKIKLLLIANSVAMIVRISMCFWQCREEQQWCFEHFADFNGISSKTQTTKIQWLITVICLGLFVTLTKVWLRNCGNLNGYSITVTLAKYAPTVVVICTSGYWVLNRLPSDTQNKLWQTDILVWTVYFLLISGIVATISKPLCIYILNEKKQVNARNEDTLIPELFKEVKKLFNEPKKDDVPVICGLGTVYSSTFIIIGLYLTLLIALLQGDAVAPSSLIMFLTASFILMITSVIRLEHSATVEKLFQIPNMYILGWVVLAHYFFYGTGHQPSFPNINWNAAFIGTSAVFSYHFIPATLIMINTFSSYILVGFFVPLISIIPFTISIILPSAVKKNILSEENFRGEVVLYERDNLMMTSVFTTSCKYMMCHALRVFASMLSATIHCRHLMVWNIFAPKFIFEGLAMFVTLFIVNVSYLILIRVNKCVDNLIVHLNKRYS